MQPRHRSTIHHAHIRRAHVLSSARLCRGKIGMLRLQAGGGDPFDEKALEP